MGRTRIGPLRLHRGRRRCRGFGYHRLGLVFESRSCVSHRYGRGHFWTLSGRHVGVTFTDVRGVLAMAVKLLVRTVSLVSRWVKHVGATVYVWIAPVGDTTLYGRA